jgi:hypothetical protein
MLLRMVDLPLAGLPRINNKNTGSNISFKSPVN